MKHFIIALALICSLSFISNAQTDSTEYCNYCITQTIGISAGAGAAGYSLGLTFWILHGELNLGADTRIPGGSTSDYEMTTYLGSTGVIMKLSNGIGMQLGIDYMRGATYQRSYTTSSVKYVDIALRQNTRTTISWHSSAKQEETYISPYLGLQVNVLGGTWLGCAYGYSRGAYFNIEFTF